MFDVGEAVMSVGGFFETPEPQSLIKADLVDKYFGAWARVILKQRQRDSRIAFVDLFSGPGAYEDGTPSTPLQLLDRVIKDAALRSSVIAVFNDRDRNLARALQNNIQELPGVESLTFAPKVLNYEVDNAIFEHIVGVRDCPTLFFIDPFGYKGVSLDLIGNAIRGWGSECILFFNYNRINPGLSNPGVSHLMANLFGESRFEDLRRSVTSVSNPLEREQIVVDKFKEALQEVGGKHVTEFKFRNRESDRTSHYIFFVSKSATGLKIMKEIMYKRSTDSRVVRRTEYAPPLTPQLSLFSAGLQDPGDPYTLNSIKNLLCSKLAGETLPVSEICARFTVSHPYIERNIKDALRELEAEGKIIVAPPQRRTLGDRLTLANHLLVTFK